MVDETLLKEIKVKMEAGAELSDVKDVLRVYELFKQISEENEYLREELEVTDISIQMNVTDEDTKFWLKFGEGTMKFGEGEINIPSFTFSGTKVTVVGMIFGEVDITSAYIKAISAQTQMAGDITVDGYLQDAICIG